MKALTYGGKDMAFIKVLVAGHFNAGKTTFINTASEIKTVSTEKQLTNSVERAYKEKTTTAMDYGETVLRNAKLAVFGIPGQERFSFMWKVLSKNTQGFIFLIDSTAPDMWYDTIRQIDMLMGYTKVPYIVAANKQDLPNAFGVSAVREKLNLTEDVRIVPCIAKDRNIVLETLEILLMEINSFKNMGV